MTKNIIIILSILALIFGATSYLMFTENMDLKEDIEMLTVENSLLTEERDTLKLEMETMLPISENNALKLVNSYIWEKGNVIAGSRSFSFHPYSPTYKIEDKDNYYEIEVLRGIGKLEGNILIVSYHALKFEVNKNTGEVVYKGKGASVMPSTRYERIS